MRKLLLLWLIFIVASLFLWIPKAPEAVDYFMFSDRKLYLATYVYFIFERLVFILMAYIIFVESTTYKREVLIFIVLLCADLVDFLLCYNDTWFYYDGSPISMNIMKVIIFEYVALNAWTRELNGHSN